MAKLSGKQLDLSRPGAIGSGVPGSAVFTTISSTGVLTVVDTTAATSTTTGAVRISGGLGVQGAVWAGSVNAPAIALSQGAFAVTVNVPILTANRALSLPNAPGTIARIEDMTGFVRNIYTNNDTATITGDTTETSILSFNLPANSIGLNGCIEFDLLTSNGNTSSSKTYRVKIGGVAVLSLVITTSASGAYRRTIRNQNSLTSQVSANPAQVGSYANFTPSVSTHAINFGVANTIEITGQLAVSTENMRLRGVSIFTYG